MAIAQAAMEAHAPWVDDLAAFLQMQTGVEALRINPQTRRLSVATLGPVDAAALEARIREVLLVVEANLAAGRVASRHMPSGLRLRQSGAETMLEKETCVTAPRFWRWQEYEWPTVERATEGEKEPEWQLLAWLAAWCGVFGLAAFLTERFGLLPGRWSLIFYCAAILTGGWDAAIDTWENLKHRKIDIHFLMLAVAAGAASIGAWSEAALLLFLFSGAGALEEFALGRTYREVNALLKTAPKQATLVLADGTEQVVPVGKVQVGHRILVKPGEAFPADGDVTKGQTAADEASLTGEAQPVEKASGFPVFSGTLNLWGAVEVEVKKLPSESTLQKIIRLIQTAQKLKSPSERFTDKFGGAYALIVLGLTTSMFLIWWLGFHRPAFVSTAGESSAFYRAMTLMVVASPCALVLSIPSAVLAAIACGAKQGILFRGGAAIEKLADVDVVALDKTGTLTTGELTVMGCESFPPGREQAVLELAVTMEAKSQHPIARAVAQYGRAHQVRERTMQEFESLTGKGLRAKLDGASCVLGRRELLVTGPLAEFFKTMPQAPADLTEVWVLSEDLIGRLLLRDDVRRESAATLARLKAAGMHTVMLTGDRRHSAEEVARTLGLDEVRAGLAPEDKVAAIEELSRKGRKVAMVGDGVNDAPSLAAAYVGVAMGARGSDAALEQAEVILMNDRIENFCSAYELSVRARRIIRQNLVISLGTVGVMVTASILGRVPLSLGVFAHEGSTVLVCLNGLRLLFTGPKAEGR